MDALDLATLIEVEAFERYTQFAERLGSSAEGDAASSFESMAVNENKGMANRIAGAPHRALRRPAAPEVKITDIFDVEAPDLRCAHERHVATQGLLVALSVPRK
ncbi:MAG: rubrerythrin, partial [Ideonella sp.]|nr:rubrerythrin [Ideonella sp.]